MISVEDYEFIAQTSVGDKRAVISKTALRTLAGRVGISSSAIAKLYRVELDAMVERKLSSGRFDDPIRLHGTDL